LTGKIVLAHLKETLDYYSRLEVAELEGDMLNALSKGDTVKVAEKYRKLVHARLALSSNEAGRL
jgi:formylmethanofuran dehydrogenase subunit D